MLGQYDKAKEYFQKGLVITTEIGDRKGEEIDYGSLGIVFKSLGQYNKAKQHLQKALVITTEIDDRKGEASCYGNLGTIFRLFGQHDKAEIGDKQEEAADLANLEIMSRPVRDYEVSEVCLEKALSIFRDIGDKREEFQILQDYAILYFFSK